MAYNIEQRKVIGVVTEANAALSGKDFNYGEILIGLSELLGRTIVEAAETHLQAQEMVKIAAQHIDRTIAVGSQARGKNLYERG